MVKMSNNNDKLRALTNAVKNWKTKLNSVNNGTKNVLALKVNTKNQMNIVSNKIINLARKHANAVTNLNIVVKEPTDSNITVARNSANAAANAAVNLNTYMNTLKKENGSGYNMARYNKTTRNIGKNIIIAQKNRPKYVNLLKSVGTNPFN
jgi:hypothetical protein